MKKIFFLIFLFMTIKPLLYSDNLEKVKEYLDSYGKQYTIVQLKHLKRLFLNELKISDEGLALIAKLPNLKALALSETNITDKGLAYIVNLKNLEILSLTGTKITDRGLLYIAKLKKLRKLFLLKTKVTKKGLRKLKRSLPKLQVFM